MVGVIKGGEHVTASRPRGKYLALAFIPDHTESQHNSYHAFALYINLCKIDRGHIASWVELDIQKGLTLTGKWAPHMLTVEKYMTGSLCNLNL